MTYRVEVIFSGRADTVDVEALVPAQAALLVLRDYLKVKMESYGTMTIHVTQMEAQP